MELECTYHNHKFYGYVCTYHNHKFYGYVCTYHNHKFYGYVCQVDDEQIPPDTELKFAGEHDDGKTDDDVKIVVFNECRVSKVPRGLTEIFPNLEGLEILNSGLKNLNRSDLVQYKDFKWFFFGANEIDYLPGDLFADCTRLEEISFNRNLLTIVEPNILDGLENLKSIRLYGEHNNYGQIVSKFKIPISDPKLIEMKEKLHTAFVKANHPKIKAEIEKFRKDNKELTKLKRFFQADEAFKDLQISIDGKQFKVHKTFIAARSPTLAKLLRNNPQAEYLNLVDISVDIFKHILNFLYTDEFPREANFMQLFAAAGRLEIEELKEYAAEKILELLNDENALEVLSLGSKYNHEGIKRKAFDIIKKKYPKIEVQEEWLNSDKKIEKMIKYFQKIRDAEKELKDSMECED